ncbi:MAG: hypothetical protein J6P79_11465 [Pseudobutyrivibrio sp.]|nr:hypothetical protein [Pseudobutyrivibrio sp.]
MRIKNYLLLILIIISSIIVSIVAIYFKDNVYSAYYSSITTTPMEALPFKAMAQGVYPWTKPETNQEEKVDLETIKGNKTTIKEFTTVDDSYFDDALFIGDSRMLGLSQYCQALSSRATFYAEKSLTIYDIKNTEWIDDGDGNKVSLAKAIEGKHFSKIYIMVGINEIGTGDVESFKDAYAKVVYGLMYLQPDATIFINSIMHVSQEKDTTDELYNNTNINERNEALKEIADNSRIFYLDINEAVDDENGNLKAETTGDGVHLKAAYYEPWHQYLLSHGVE